MRRAAKIHDHKSDTAWQRNLRSEKEWVFRATLKLPGLWRMLRRGSGGTALLKGRLVTRQMMERVAANVRNLNL